MRINLEPSSIHNGAKRLETITIWHLSITLKMTNISQHFFYKKSNKFFEFKVIIFVQREREKKRENRRKKGEGKERKFQHNFFSILSSISWRISIFIHQLKLGIKSWKGKIRVLPWWVRNLCYNISSYLYSFEEHGIQLFIILIFIGCDWG